MAIICGDYRALYFAIIALKLVKLNETNKFYFEIVYIVKPLNVYYYDLLFKHN